jgi:4-oxalocrotonate tautomerase
MLGGDHMPMTQIFLRSGKSAEYRQAIADGVQKALTRAIGVPPAERFQLITELATDQFIFDLTFQNVTRSTDFVMIVITLKAGRTGDQKKGLYAAIVEELEDRPKVHPGNVMIVLHENGPADWSFGNGKAQLLV